MKDTSLARVGALSGFAVAILSIAYAVAYLILTPTAQRGADPAAFYSSFAADPTGRQLANLCFVLSGALAPFVVAGVSERLRGLSEGWARWALVVGVISQLAVGVHGIWGMVLTPRLADIYANGDAATKAAAWVLQRAPVPSDPSEFLTFAITGVWALVVGLLVLRGADLPRWLGYVSIVAGVDLIALFIADAIGAGTLVLLTGGPASLILGPAMWAGFGWALLRGGGAPAVQPVRVRSA